MIYRIFTKKVVVSIASILAVAVLLTVCLPDVSAANQVAEVLFAVASIPLIFGTLVFMVYGLKR